MAFREIINGGKCNDALQFAKLINNTGACNAGDQQSSQVNQNPFKNFVNYMVTGKANMGYANSS